MTGETLLLRQVHPSFVQQGRITSQAFKPTPKDEGHLSVYDGDLIDTEASWKHYTGTLSLSSCGVVAVTVSECEAESLPAAPDPESFPEHAIIDFTACESKSLEKKSKRLKERAVARGWLHQA